VPPVLTPPQEERPTITKPSSVMDSTLTRLRFASQVFNRPQPSTIPGNSNHSAYGRKTEARFERNCRLPFFAGVEILITTSTAEFPGVTAVEGLKMH